MLRARPVAAFVVLSCAITWVLVLPLVLSGLGLVAWRVSPHWHVLGALGPITAAFLVTVAVAGRAGAADLLARMGRWRVGLPWLLAGVASPLLLLALALLGVRVVGGAWPDVGVLAVRDAVWWWGGLAAALAYGIGEEAGWRGFLLPRLQERRSALAATAVLTLAWAAWHVPMFAYRFDFGVVEVVGFFVGLFAGAVWLTALHNGSGGSVFVVAAWHAGWNVVNILALPVSMAVVATMSTLVMVAAVAVVVAWGPRRLAPGEARRLTVER